MERELTVEEAESLMRKGIRERMQEGKPPKYTSFALPITPEGTPLLFERMQAPHAGLYSVIGGKMDESGLVASIHSGSSARFNADGFETPTAGLLRELDEELYGETLKEQGMINQGDRLRLLEERLQPTRKAYVYDYPQNALNALYLVQQQPNLMVHPDVRELGKMKLATELKPEEINPLSRFLLNLSGYTYRGMEGITWGRVGHIPLPSDILKALPHDDKATLDMTLSHQPETPAYVIQYGTSAASYPERN